MACAASGWPSSSSDCSSSGKGLKGGGGSRGGGSSGPAAVRLREHFLVVCEEEGQEGEGSGALLECFWQVVDAMAGSEQQALLRFITGSCQLPAPGSMEVSGVLPACSLPEPSCQDAVQVHSAPAFVADQTMHPDTSRSCNKLPITQALLATPRYPVRSTRSYAVTQPSLCPPPPALLQALRIELPFVPLTAAERRQALHMLPQAHTCANTLALPDYWQALLQVGATWGSGAALVSGRQCMQKCT